MGYQRDREKFIRQFARQFPKGSASDCLALLRAASGEQRWNEIDSSIEISDRERARLEKASERRMARVAKLCASIGAVLETGGDPRGCPFKLHPAGTTREEAERRMGLGVPGRGLPARCFQ